MADYKDPGRAHAARDLASAGYRGGGKVRMPDGKSNKRLRGAQGAPDQIPPNNAKGRQDPMDQAAPMPDDRAPTQPFAPGNPNEQDL